MLIVRLMFYAKCGQTGTRTNMEIVCVAAAVLILVFGTLYLGNKWG